MELSASTEALRTAIGAALATVNDPEINRPITELGMVKSVDVADDGAAAIGVYLTVSGCPMRDEITGRVTNAVSKVEGITGVSVELDVMSDEQRTQAARPRCAATSPSVRCRSPSPSRSPACSAWPAARAASASRR